MVKLTLQHAIKAAGNTTLWPDRGGCSEAPPRPLYAREKIQQHNRIDGPQGRSGRVRTMSRPPEFDPGIAQLVAKLVEKEILTWQIKKLLVWQTTDWYTARRWHYVLQENWKTKWGKGLHRNLLQKQHDDDNGEATGDPRPAQPLSNPWGQHHYHHIYLCIYIRACHNFTPAPWWVGLLVWEQIKAPLPSLHWIVTGLYEVNNTRA